MSRFVDERFDGIQNSIGIAAQSGFVLFGTGAGSIVGTDSNRVRASGTSSVAATFAWMRTGPVTRDYEVGCDFYVTAGGFTASVDPPLGILGRADTASDIYYFVRAHPTTGWTLYRVLNGTPTAMTTSVAQTWVPSTTYKVRLVMIGEQISVWVDGVKIIDFTDTFTLTASGYPGLRNVGGFLGSLTTGIHLDNFYADDYVNRTTFHDYSAVPADSAAASSTLTTATVVPPAGMVAQQLVVVISAHRAAGATFAMGVNGGQLWDRVALGGASSLELHWTQFNGTWSASPQVVATGATATVPISHVMLVFNPGRVGPVAWGLGIDGPLISMATSPFTLTGHDTFFDTTLSLAVWVSQDDNTWNLSDEFGWQNAGCNQWRNTAGNDMSIHVEYCALTAPGTLTDPGTTQQTLGPDAATGAIITFAELAGMGSTFQAAWARGANQVVGQVAVLQ